MLLIGLLLAGYVGAGYAASSTPAGVAAGPTDTEPPPDPEPAPDPAPPPPKPAPKPAPKPVTHPAKVYRAPAPTPKTPATRTHDTAPSVVHHAKPKPVRRPNHKRHKKKVKHVAVAPKPKAHVKAQVKGASVVRIGGVPAAAVTTNQGDQARNTTVIAGTTLAALIFLLVVTVPATRARFTGPGRMVMDHQTDLVLAGVTVLVLAAIIFALTGNAP